MPKCKICSDKFEPKYFLQKHCEKVECKVSYSMQVVAKQKFDKEKKVKQDWNKEKVLIKEKLKTLSEYKKDLQTEINSIVREIDKGHPCIATGATTGKMNAGHYIGVGANSTLRFHLENIWIQSEHSNSWKSGDTIRYQNGIVGLYGKEYLEHLNNLQSIQPIHLSIDDIKEKIPIARGLLKWLKLQDRVYSNLDRLSIRKEFNQKIGIY